jgi:hypothetical protein
MKGMGGEIRRCGTHASEARLKRLGPCYWRVLTTPLPTIMDKRHEEKLRSDEMTRVWQCWMYVALRLTHMLKHNHAMVVMNEARPIREDIDIYIEGYSTSDHVSIN